MERLDEPNSVKNYKMGRNVGKDCGERYTKTRPEKLIVKSETTENTLNHHNNLGTALDFHFTLQCLEELYNKIKMKY